MGNLTFEWICKFANLLVFSLWFQIAYFVESILLLPKFYNFSFIDAYTNVIHSFQDEARVWVERTSDGMVNVMPTFAAVLDIAHYILMCWNKCVLDTLCVWVVRVSKPSLTLDGFINDLYKQSIFLFGSCLNALLLIIYCCSKKLMACQYCFMQLNKVLQYGLLA